MNGYAPEYVIVNGNELEHKAYDWWKKRLSKVVCAKSEPRLFCVELFPYYSKNTFQFPSLPSDKYAASLILNAMQSNKLIVIMRCRKGWIKRVPQLATYQNCICLNTPRCAYISPTNTSKSGMSWNNFVFLKWDSRFENQDFAIQWQNNFLSLP